MALSSVPVFAWAHPDAQYFINMYGKHSECDYVFFTLLDLGQVQQVGFEAICVLRSFPFLPLVRELLSTSPLPVYWVFGAGV